jgi:hypothetical protein
MSLISRKLIGIMTCVILVALVTPCYGDWSEEDTAREVVYLGLHIVDWGQTLYIADHPNEYHERNRLMFSEHPSRGEVNWKFAVGMVIHPVVSYLLPRPYREIWQYSTIGLEIYCVGNNVRIGIGMGF